MPLAQLLEQCPFRPDTLVIDVEGSETCLVEGPPLPLDIRQVVIELHPHRIGYDPCFTIVRWLRDQGFEVLRMQDWVLLLRRTSDGVTRVPRQLVEE